MNSELPPSPSHVAGGSHIQHTPVTKKSATTMPFTSMTVMCDETIIAIGQEIRPHIVGPMPGKDFLDFLPTAEGFQEKWNKGNRKTKKENAKFKNATRESVMYGPFIKAMEYYCPRMTGVDTSVQEVVSISGQKIKPDFMYFRKEAAESTRHHRKSEQEQKADIFEVEIIGEAKLSPGDDPFLDDARNPLISETAHALQTLGQVTLYAIAQLGSQFRTHIFSFLLFKDSARLMRWDRAGVVVTELIPLDSSILAEFFWKYNHASDEERGVDTTVKPFYGDNVKIQDVFDRLQFHKEDAALKVEDIKFYKMTLPSGKSYIIGKPAFLGVSSLASRATRTFKAWCLTSEKAVFLKDTWRIFSGSQKPEHEIYAKLQKAKVKYIPTVLDSGDISGLYQQTRTGTYSHETWVKNKISLRTLQHYRSVFQEIGRDLTSFTDLHEALTAVANAIQAHGDAYCDAKVLHRDISAGNILIYDGHGLLIDWEMARDLEAPVGPSNITRIGTWAFQAVELQLPGKVEHTHYHDLESFYHVLGWLSLRHARHDSDGPALASLLHSIFDASIERNGNSTASTGKAAHMLLNLITDGAKFHNRPLTSLLQDLGYVFRSLYMTPERIEKLAAGDRDGQEVLQKNTEKSLHKLKSDERHKWAGDLIMQSIHNPSNVWGDISHFTHKIPPLQAPPKRKFTDMMTSNLLFPGQKADFSPANHDGVEDQDIDDDDAEDEEQGIDKDGFDHEENEEQTNRRVRRKLSS